MRGELLAFSGDQVCIKVVVASPSWMHSVSEYLKAAQGLERRRLLTGSNASVIPYSVPVLEVASVPANPSLRRP